MSSRFSLKTGSNFACFGVHSNAGLFAHLVAARHVGIFTATLLDVHPQHPKQPMMSSVIGVSYSNGSTNHDSCPLFAQVIEVQFCPS